MTGVICIALLWLVFVAIAFVNAWNGGRRPARLVLRLLLKLHLFILGTAAMLVLVVWSFQFIR